MQARPMTMSNAHKGLLIRTLHTAISLILAASVVFLLVAAFLDYFGPVLLVAVILIGIEVIVFVASSMKCPLTDLVPVKDNFRSSCQASETSREELE
ncbi:MAG: hypothetical protein ACXVCM_24245 [Ktedonobacteraceae bacterium]